MKRVCEACGGTGYVIVGAGLAALERRYPSLPIREMEKRGWLAGLKDVEDVADCEAAFFRFWQVTSHAEVQEILSSCAPAGGG
jgi:hypothetical protein